MLKQGPGYAINERVFPSERLAPVLVALTDPAVVRSRAGARHVLSVPAVERLAKDAKLLEIASEFVGRAPYPFRATLFDKSAGSN
jgi:hypothetical protein